MKIQSRYVKTKVEGSSRLLHMNTCNLCPLLQFDADSKIARCAKYSSETVFGHDIDYDVWSYSVVSNRSVPIKHIEIPEWCGLPSDILLINKDGNMYVKNGNMYDTIPGIYGNLVTTSTLYVDYDKKLERLIYNSTKNLNLKNIKALPEKTKTYTSLSTCSCCGELVEDVDRNKNFGMCPKCWEQNKDNEKMKQFAFVNNFRLKRSANWTDEMYKKIKEID